MASSRKKSPALNATNSETLAPRQQQRLHQEPVLTAFLVRLPDELRGVGMRQPVNDPSPLRRPLELELGPHALRHLDRLVVRQMLPPPQTLGEFDHTLER